MVEEKSMDALDLEYKVFCLESKLRLAEIELTYLRAENKRLNEYFDETSAQFMESINMKAETYTLEMVKLDAYNILGIPVDTDPEIIKKIYSKLALIYHPDKGLVQDDFHFKKITNAYNTIFEFL